LPEEPDRGRVADRLVVHEHDRVLQGASLLGQADDPVHPVRGRRAFAFQSSVSTDQVQNVIRRCWVKVSVVAL